MKFTKIVCTIGPASEQPAMLKKMIKAGMNVARLNFSHGTHPSHAQLIKNIRATAKAVGQPIAILQDLQGPRIRIGEVAEQGVQLKKGDRVIVVPQSHYRPAGVATLLPTHFSELSKAVAVGQHILIADGIIDLRIVKIAGPEIHCVVVVPGVVKSHKGINVPGASFMVSSLTPKDREDAAFGAGKGVDYMALSFVRGKEDILALRRLLRTLSKKIPHASDIGIIAKIERPEAVDNFDEILEVVDAIMVARGDLGIEIPAQKVPLVQKQLIAKCIRAHVPVIVATQMLESMISSRRPTRAEVSDVANAVIDHTDAVMLSGESATGLYPLETVELMADTIHETEKSKYNDFICGHAPQERTFPEMIGHAVCDIVMSKKIKLVIVEGSIELVRMISTHRPEVRVVGFSADAHARQQLNLLYGVTVFAPQKNVFTFLKKSRLARTGDALIFVEDNEIEIEILK
ncbi:MAG: pyruvate kinase [Patescibacteria group bacterium]